MKKIKNKYINNDSLNDNTKEVAIRNVGITLSAQGVKLILQISSIPILSRLLEPADFGLVAMATIFTGLIFQFMEGGLSIATIQRANITHAQLSNLFWINTAMGAGLCFLTIVSAPLVALIYDEPKLIMIIEMLSLTFLISGLSVQHDALLRRQMRFKAISTIDIISLLTGIIAGIAAAFGGLKYWALVISPIATCLMQTILRWINARWMPSMVSRGSGVRSLLRFGANLTGANFIGYFANNITPFTIGYIGNAQSIGFFSRANMLTSIPSSQILPPVMSVVQPILARVANDPTKLRNTIKSIMGKLVLGTMFVTVTMSVLADWIVQLFLGSDWEESIPIFRMLAVFSLVEPIACFLAVSLIAMGNVKALLHWKAITLIIIIVSIAIGSIWGTFGVVAAYALSGVFIRLPSFLFYSSHFLPLTISDFTKTLVPSAICSMGTAAVLIFLRYILTIENSIIGLTVFAIIAAVIYTTFCWFAKPTRRELMDIIRMLKIKIK